MKERRGEGAGEGGTFLVRRTANYKFPREQNKISIFELKGATETGGSQQGWESSRDKKNYATLNPIYRVWWRIWCFLWKEIRSDWQVLSRKWNGIIYYIMYILYNGIFKSYIFKGHSGLYGENELEGCRREPWGGKETIKMSRCWQ